jgi:Cdc6-like AAA superfamily ATPase
MTSHPHELTPKDLRREADTEHLGFTTTQELKPAREIIGQPRGIRAIEFGIGIDSPGFNIYVLGPTGSGRTTAITQFLEERAESGRVPCDWVYVYNFEVMHQPRAIELPPGMGELEMIWTALMRTAEIPNALAEELAQAAEHLENEFTERRVSLQRDLQHGERRRLHHCPHSNLA